MEGGDGEDAGAEQTLELGDLELCAVEEAQEVGVGEPARTTQTTSRQV